MIDTKTETIDTLYGFKTRDDIIAHLKSVGQKIIDDAELIAPRPRNTTRIYISATIEACEITKVEYDIECYVDPQIKEKP